MSLEITIKEEPPKELIYIIEENYNPEDNIEKVLINANNETLDKDALGGFFPETKSIIIDLAHCVENKGWMGFGMMMIQTVWFNMLRAVFHELGHAMQLSQNQSIKNMAILTPQLEEDADTFATEMIHDWAETGKTIPKIDNMGWAGEQLKLIINTCYGNKELQPKIIEELTVLEANGVAEVDTFTAHNQKSLGKREYSNLCESIDNKDIGIKIGNKRYLDPIGFFSFIIDKNKAAQNQADEAKKEE
jgi:hypothetical protein